MLAIGCDAPPVTRTRQIKATIDIIIQYESKSTLFGSSIKHHTPSDCSRGFILIFCSDCVDWKSGHAVDAHREVTSLIVVAVSGSWTRHGFAANIATDERSISPNLEHMLPRTFSVRKFGWKTTEAAIGLTTLLTLWSTEPSSWTFGSSTLKLCYQMDTALS